MLMDSSAVVMENQNKYDYLKNLPLCQATDKSMFIPFL